MTSVWETIARHLRRRRERTRPGAYRPVLIEHCDHAQLLADVAELTGGPRDQIAALFSDYRAVHHEQDYERVLGELKTLCFEEAFVLYAFLALRRPHTIVEIGTQHGKSTRRIIDMRARLCLDSQIVCFDIDDQVRHFAPHEARLVLEDVTDRFRERVLEGLHPELIFLDARPYRLLYNVIGGVIGSGTSAVLAIHDCTKGLCNPQMTLSREETRITSHTGIWERWVLAEIFGVADPLSDVLDDAVLPTHRLKILGTRHGLALLVPRGPGQDGG